MTERQRGQSVVELALVLPVLLLLVLGAICAMQILLTQQAVASAARAAAHQAALLGGPDGQDGALHQAGGQVAEAARLALAGGIGTDPSRATIAVVCRDERGAPVSACRRYQPITVTISYHDGVWVPIPPLFSEINAQFSATRAAEKDQQ